MMNCIEKNAKEWCGIVRILEFRTFRLCIEDLTTSLSTKYNGVPLFRRRYKNFDK